MKTKFLLPRRQFLCQSAAMLITGSALSYSQQVLASESKARSLTFNHTHTGERLSLVYAVDNQYIPQALTQLNHFLRDHYSGQVGAIDPQLFDLLFQLKQTLGTEQAFDVISGYRCVQTNSTLRNTRGGGVARHSLHMDGKAIDIRCAGAPLSDLGDAARSLRLGGVGFYKSEQFVHVDTGRIRYW